VTAKITTWNINGLRAREGEVLEWVYRERPDVLCLQEIKATLPQVPEALRQLDGYHGYWHGAEKGYSGVALLVKRAGCPPRPVFGHPAFDHEGRIVTAALGDLDVASIYVPNGGKDLKAKLQFLDAMGRWVADAHARGRRLLLCGDLNVTLTPRDVHHSEVNPEQLGQTAEERGLMATLLGHGLADLLRQLDPSNDDLFTWWAPWRQHRERNIGWRLDYVLASEPLARRAQSCRVERLFGTSDHGPVTAVFEGPLFEAAAVVEGPPQEAERAEPAAPQLDLFGR